MHFEILVEGQTELTALSILLPKIVGAYAEPHTWKIHKHRGIGKLPADPASRPNPKDPSLLHNLPAKLRAYGSSLQANEAVIVLVDLDDREDCVAFKQELLHLLQYCETAPQTRFRIAIEELEAWFLGDIDAVVTAYPEANTQVMQQYVQDSQCGTWEVLADVVHTGGVSALQGSYGRRSTRVLEQKRIWASHICPHMAVENNQSPSFCAFRDGLRRFSENGQDA